MATKVYDYYQLMFEGKEFSLEHKKLLKSGVKIDEENEHLLRINENPKTSGKMYILNEKDTEKFYAVELDEEKQPIRQKREPKSENKTF